MKNIIHIAQWEYFEKIKNKTFLFSTILFPLIIIGLFYLQTLLSTEEDKSTKVIALYEKNISIHQKLENELIIHKTQTGQPLYLIRKFVVDGLNKSKLIDSCYTLIKDDLLTGLLYIEKINDDSLLIEYHTENVTALKDISRIEKAINSVLLTTKLEAFKIDKELVDKIIFNVPIKTIKVTEKGSEEINLELTFASSYFFVLFLIISMFSISGSMVRSIIEEKSNRVIEIILSSCTTDELLTGKVVGIALLGLTQILIWFGILIPVLGPLIITYLRIENIPLNILFFVLGFIFYSTIFIGLGSIANSEQEAQGIFSIVSIMIVFPVLTSFIIFESPNSTIAKLLSFFPLTTAPTMIIRVNTISIPLVDKIVSILILIFSIISSIWFSSRILRISLLSYGKTPNIYEILNWLKQK